MTKKNDIYPNLGPNIRALRKLYHERAIDLAVAIDVAANTISSYESGCRFPEPDKLMRLAKHFRVTESELLTGDYKSLPVLPKELPDNDESCQFFISLFPVFCTDSAITNASFKEAYEYHTQKILPSILSGIAADSSAEDDWYEKCVLQYAKARQEGVLEAAANQLALLALFGITTRILTPRLIDMADVLSNSSLKYLFEALLPSFDEPASESDFDTTAGIEEFLNACEVDFLVDIALLKKHSKWADLGDYYFALRYFFDLLHKDELISKSSPASLGLDLLFDFHRLGNKYCSTFLGVNKPK